MLRFLQRFVNIIDRRNGREQANTREKKGASRFEINSLFPSIPIRKDNKSVLGGAHYPQVCLLIVC